MGGGGVYLVRLVGGGPQCAEMCAQYVVSHYCTADGRLSCILTGGIRRVGWEVGEGCVCGVSYVVRGALRRSNLGG